MDRCAVFVDVGYLYAAGGIACVGTKIRSRFDVDIQGVVAMLAAKAGAECGTPLLRTYWYDGAARGIPTAEHRRAGQVDDVKLRLGTINSRGQQKGVDALIYRDLMTLARERAISHAFLLAGDADLVEGVRAAQDLGTHVTLMHITGGSGQGTSPDLLHEVDRRIALSRDDLAAYFTKRPEKKPAEAAVSAVAPDTPTAALPTVAQAAEAYAQKWVKAATDGDVQALSASYPKIPPQIDAELLSEVERARGGVSLRGDQVSRRAMRQSFWLALKAIIGSVT